VDLSSSKDYLKPCTVVRFTKGQRFYPFHLCGRQELLSAALVFVNIGIRTGGGKVTYNELQGNLAKALCTFLLRG